MSRLARKTAIITGATSGIGAATAVLFAEHGANLVLTGRRARLGEDVARQCRDVGAECVFVETDHTQLADCEEVIQTALDAFGGIDILFNNAGIVPRGTAETTELSVWQSTFDTNVTAVWQMCRLVVPHMRARGGGAIVNHGSDWSVVGGTNALAYVSSKGAVAMMTKAMALDHAPDNIRVNAVCPGDTFVERFQKKLTTAQAVAQASAHIPLKRFATPAEIAYAVLYLASPESSYVTGHLLLVDGGHTAQ
ncbi:SDR family NAD(P)-dependent oxidoreductase [Steroidobacter flavus]|uniref:SDR family NAD(P)-dependent oxidoreductase n=1 Tax=Steroidobacter flavus TaxID=1842136 RepID=A0ABV8SME9_9GAMM